MHSAGLVSIFCMDIVASVMQGYVARPRGDTTFTLDDGTGGIVVSPSVLDDWLWRHLRCSHSHCAYQTEHRWKTSRPGFSLQLVGSRCIKALAAHQHFCWHGPGTSRSRSRDTTHVNAGGADGAAAERART